jgi:hypothetical protein
VSVVDPNGTLLNPSDDDDATFDAACHVAAEYVARTGGGRCWYCGEVCVSGDLELTKTAYAKEPPSRFWHGGCMPTREDQLAIFRSVESFLALATAGLDELARQQNV